MAKIFRYIFLFFILCLLNASIQAYAKDVSIYEQYFLNKVKGQKIGHSYVIQKKIKQNGEIVLLTHQHSEQKFKRYGLPIDVIQDVKFYEDEEFNPIMLEVKNVAGEERNSYVANFLPNNKVLVKHNSSDGQEVKNIELKEKVVFPFGIKTMFENQDFEGVLEYSTVDTDGNFRIVNIKAVKEREKGKYNIYLDLLPNIKNEQWRNEQGYLIREVSSLLGVEKIATNKEEIFPSYNNVFQKSRILSNGKIGNISNVKEITYKIFLEDYDKGKVPDFAEDQRIIQCKDGVAYIKAKLNNYDDQKFRYPPKLRGFDRYLAPSKVLDFGDAKVSTFIKNELAKHPNNSYKFAKRLEKYVRDEIHSEKNSVEITPMSHSFLAGSGDATDKAIILAGLLRAAKIPSKVILGVKYTNSPQSSFVYHCWVNAYVGKWISLDPSSDSELFDAGHIALQELDLRSEVGDVQRQIFLSFINEIAGMKIVILDFDLIKKSALASQGNINGDFSDASLLDYVKKSGMDMGEVGLNKQNSSDRTFIRLKNIEAKKYVNKAIHHYVGGDMDKALVNFERVFELTPVNDDYLNVNYANKLASLGFFHLAKNRLSNISEHKVWSAKIEKFYKMSIPKVELQYDDEKRLANLLSQVEFAAQDIDVKHVQKQLGSKKYQNCDYSNFIMSKIYFTKADTKKSLRYINKALRINPNNSFYHMHKLNILSSRKKYAQALREIAWLLDNADIDNHIRYGLKMHREYLLSKKYWLARKKNYHLARFWVLSKQNKRAKQLLQEELQNRWHKDALYVLLGELYYNEKDISAARENFSKALSYNKNNIEAIEKLGDLKTLEHKPAQGLVYYCKALSKNKKSADLILKVADSYKNLLKEEDALINYLRVLRLDPNNYQAIYNIAKIKGKYGDNSDLSDVYKRVLSINPRYVEAWFGLVKLALLDKNAFLAKKYLKSVSYIDKQNPEYYYYSGLIEVMNENYSYARKDFQSALSLDPYYEKAQFELDKLK